jgi:diguanylate cyclase (GGDEF)-like protein
MGPARILIIDDDEADRKAAYRALTQSNWRGEVALARDAEEAKRQIGGGKIDCIFLDYNLPGSDGLVLLTELHELLGERVPIIMLTGEGSELVAVEAMKRGASDYLPKSLLTSDAMLRVIANSMERQKLKRDLSHAQSQLEQQALYDGLTGLGNRSLFRRDLARAISSGERRNAHFCLLMMDLDRFKTINDTYGHEVGDGVLAEIGRRLALTARAGDAFYRLGGDEFTAILDAPSQSAVSPLVQRVARGIGSPIQVLSFTFVVGISQGIAVYPHDGTSSEALLRSADAAMYSAKRIGSERAVSAVDA